MDQTDDDGDLFRRWQQDGDQRARDTLLRRHPPLLREEAYRAARRGFDYDDAYQLAALGFLHALDKYEFEHGASLKTYARRWIRQNIYRGRQYLGPVYRPAHVLGTMPRIYRAQLQLRNEGIEPTADEVAQLSGLTAHNVTAFIASSQTAVPLDAPIGSEGGDATYLDLLADSRDSPEDFLEAKQRRHLLEEAIETLPPLQAESARLYYLEGLTMDEVGARRGVGRQAISLIMKKVDAGLQKRLAG